MSSEKTRDKTEGHVSLDVSFVPLRDRDNYIYIYIYLSLSLSGTDMLVRYRYRYRGRLKSLPPVALIPVL